MSSNSQVFELTDRHQLIDLNKEKVNFKVVFSVVSDPVGEEFKAIVMNQNDLNNYAKLDDIQMKVAPGKIGGTIVADNNTYQNYFLILKSIENKKTKVQVQYNIEDVQPQEEAPNAEQEDSMSDLNITAPDVEIKTKLPSDTPIYKRVWFWIIFAIGAIILGYMCYDYIANRREGYHNQIKKALANANYNTASSVDTTSVMESGATSFGQLPTSEQSLHDSMTQMAKNV
jgi:hypothetical protein